MSVDAAALRERDLPVLGTDDSRTTGWASWAEPLIPYITGTSLPPSRAFDDLSLDLVSLCLQDVLPSSKTAT